MLIITVLCLIIGFGIGSVAAQPVSDTLLSGQIENAKLAARQGGIMGGIMLGSSTEKELVPIDQVDVSVGMDTILEIAVIALLLASLASVVAIAKLRNMSPSRF